jgi:xanthine dehydrogenase accessory factor
LAVSKLMKDLGFVVEIFDDRKALSTFENNPYADKKHLINYDDIDKLVPQGESIYVVIMTFGHQSDQEVLVKLIDKNFKYLGLMGSKSKIATLLEKTGIASSKEKLARVHAPIGLSINSKTPMEIAVSIAAEIIQIKNTED